MGAPGEVTGGSSGRAGGAVADRDDEFLTTAREDLAALPPSGHGDEPDNHQSEGETDHHAENECKHVVQRDLRQPRQTTRRTQRDRNVINFSAAGPLRT